MMMKITKTPLPLLHIEPPTVNIAPEVQVAVPGDSFQIRCVARGTNPITVTWTREEGELNPDSTSRNGILSIRNARPEDAGRYKCSASNDVGEDEAFAVVRMIGKSGGTAL